MNLVGRRTDSSAETVELAGEMMCVWLESRELDSKEANLAKRAFLTPHGMPRPARVVWVKEYYYGVIPVDEDPSEYLDVLEIAAGHVRVVSRGTKRTCADPPANTVLRVDNAVEASAVIVHLNKTRPLAEFRWTVSPAGEVFVIQTSGTPHRREESKASSEIFLDGFRAGLAHAEADRRGV